MSSVYELVIMVTTSSQIQYPLESHDPATLHPEIEDDAVPSYADAVVQTSLFKAEAAPRPERSARTTLTALMFA
jgi:hypothetical protein